MPFPLYQRQVLPRLLVLLAVLMLSACGFHLRGSVNLPFRTIYLGFAGDSSLGAELKRSLRTGGVKVVDQVAEAEAVMQVLADTREKKILSLGTNGRVREYSLYQRFRFQIKDQAGKILVAPTDIALKRDVSYDASQELAKQSEETLLYRDMQSDLVQQILRRLSAAKPGSVEPIKE
ncbi:MAG TPA: LPS assembly lipoprotein LptE [Herbaspirillum sp.]|nr:LPS assembly lipoprotein LptE [Herbaspirillum sp.]